MTLKKIVLFCTLSLSLFASCKKHNSSSSSNYHFTATVDGQSQNFNTSPPFAVKVSNAGVSIIAIEGVGGTLASPQIIAVSWTNLSPGIYLTAGNYSDTSSVYSLGGNYNPLVSTSYVSGNAVTNVSGLSGVTHLKMTITSIDSTAVKGTFSGDFYLNADLSSSKKSITNGDFYVPWKK